MTRGKNFQDQENLGNASIAFIKKTVDQNKKSN